MTSSDYYTVKLIIISKLDFTKIFYRVIVCYPWFHNIIYFTKEPFEFIICSNPLTAFFFIFNQTGI